MFKRFHSKKNVDPLYMIPPVDQKFQTGKLQNRACGIIMADVIFCEIG